ncbi:MAG: hypothetical protein JRE64_09525, partial [Deltaproteobacteria bacterium]|nr:hypothetical protein [Deltaproteobacteria bacterium]
LVQRDLEMAFSSVTREKDWLAKLRQWEILILTTLSALIIDNKIQNEWVAVVPILLAIVVLALETNIRWNIFETGLKTSRQERLLEEKTLSIFQDNIINWRFGTGPSNKELNGWDKIWSRVKCLNSPSVFLWHLPILILVIIQMFWKFKIL